MIVFQYSYKVISRALIDILLPTSKDRAGKLLLTASRNFCKVSGVLNVRARSGVS